MEFKIKDIVKDNKAHFSFYRGGNMFYAVTVHGTKWMFPVSLEDIAGASLFAEMKAITLMRYICHAVYSNQAGLIALRSFSRPWFQTSASLTGVHIVEQRIRFNPRWCCGAIRREYFHV
jgi:hypothetical protein